MKILIFGANGMLGHALMKVFRKFRPVGFDRADIDMAVPEDVLKALQETRPDLVINAAGYTAVDDAETHEEQAFLINGDAVGFLAEICAQKQIPLVHFSTDYVFDGTRQDGYDEAAKPRPLNAYGRSKLAGEEFLRKYGFGNIGSDGSGAPFYLIRTSWLFGPHGKNFVDTMLRMAQEQNFNQAPGKDPQTIRVVNDQIGKPTYTFDLAEAVLLLFTEQRPFGTYHLVNEGAVSWYDFAREIFDLACVSVDLQPVSSDMFVRPARRPFCSILLNTRFPLLRSHRDALQDYLNL